MPREVPPLSEWHTPQRYEVLVIPYEGGDAYRVQSNLALTDPETSSERILL